MPALFFHYIAMTFKVWRSSKTVI